MSSKVFIGEGTDRGRVRDENQDATVFFRTRDDIWTLLIVCDGMGGHAGGSQASTMASEGIGQGFADRVAAIGPVDALRDSIKATNRQMIDFAERHTEFRGMGTTCAVLAVTDNKAYVAHVGDSRVYRIRAGSVEQMTKDHSYVQHMIDSGVLTAEQADQHPDANRLMRCLGGASDVIVDVMGPEPVLAGDRYLLCSDGLWGQVSAAEIAAMSMAFPAQDAVNRLINLANERGGPDNISVQLYHQGDAHPPTGSFCPENFLSTKFGDRSDIGTVQVQPNPAKSKSRQSGIVGLVFMAIGVFFLLMMISTLLKKTETPPEPKQPDEVEKNSLPKKESAVEVSVSNNRAASSPKENNTNQGKPLPSKPADLKNKPEK
jgi:serine/threonine protein phosphatase PrpC